MKCALLKDIYSGLVGHVIKSSPTKSRISSYSRAKIKTDARLDSLRLKLVGKIGPTTSIC